MIRLLRALQASYLRYLIKHAEQAALIHDWHASQEPTLAALARVRAAELRAELLAITTRRSNDGRTT